MAEGDEHGGDDPCFAHLLINGQVVDPQTQKDVAQFRRAERARLMALRRAMAVERLKEQAAVISQGLTDLIKPRPGLIIAAYWPIRGELDLRDWMADAHETGARIALPVVVTKDTPVAFHHWSPQARMTRGIWNIPVPAAAEILTPDVVISPLLGVDAAGFRLGNGGGYYDRTLGAAQPLPQVIGVGHDFCRIDTIFPMPWDIPMQQVLLGDGSITRHP